MTGDELDRALALRGIVIIGALLLAGPLFIGLVSLTRRFRRASKGGLPRERAEAGPATAPARSGGPPLWTRYATLIGFTAVFLGTAYLGRVPFWVFILAVIAVGSWEYWRLLVACHIQPYQVLGWLANLALGLAAYLWGVDSLGVVTAIAAAVICAGAVVISGLDGYLSRVSGTLMGVVYVGLLSSFLVLMRVEPHGLGQIVFFFAVIQFGDVFALLGGVSIGGPKMVPTISPGKTWAGTVSGFLGTLVGAWVFGFVLPEHSKVLLLGCGALMFATGLLGDLSASCLKRAGGLKDFSNILPGHGGILDRFDSMLLSAPVAWVFLNLL